MKWTIAAIKAANEKAGKYWFSPDTMRFFNSRVLPTVYSGPGGVYFVSSEQFDADSPRLFTLRKFDPETGYISKTGEFQEYRSKVDAREAAKRAAKGDK